MCLKLAHKSRDSFIDTTQLVVKTIDNTLVHVPTPILHKEEVSFCLPWFPEGYEPGNLVQLIRQPTRKACFVLGKALALEAVENTKGSNKAQIEKDMASKTVERAGVRVAFVMHRKIAWTEAAKSTYREEELLEAKAYAEDE